MQTVKDTLILGLILALYPVALVIFGICLLLAFPRATFTGIYSYTKWLEDWAVFKPENIRSDLREIFSIFYPKVGE